jgi:hypothetical protein
MHKKQTDKKHGVLCKLKHDDESKRQNFAHYKQNEIGFAGF